MTPGDRIQMGGRAPFAVMDLFAGCGGFAEGFRSYGAGLGGKPRFQSLVAVERDRAAAATFAANHTPGHLHAGDIEEFDPLPYLDQVDVVTGGPPCQGFSGLGKGDPSDPRNKLWMQYQRVVSMVRPKIFVMENVRQFMESEEYALLVGATGPKGPLSEYELTAKVVNAADYGVPQARQRAIVIGTRRDLGSRLEHPSETHAKDPSGADSTLFEESRAPWRTVESIFERSARLRIEGTELPRGRNEVSRGGKCGPVQGPYATAELHFGRNPTALSLARYAAIPAGGNRRDLRGKWAEIDGVATPLSTASWDGHNNGSGDVMGRLRLKQPSVTIRTEFFKPEKGRYLHPLDDRPITHYEAALIQGFPEEYQWYGKKIEIARQIGNAVPVGLGRAIADAVYRYLADSDRA
ncbi:DNA cytosine methyltransferase [Streptomyces sp. NPDC051994]|uniref:DNA cytosine methyltransferase n=1 Tax=unclassified Streptomyces TaxID=2593676 RepID=UPI003417BC95